MTPITNAIANCLKDPRADAPRAALADALAHANEADSAAFVRAQIGFAQARRAVGKMVGKLEQQAAFTFPPASWQARLGAPVENWLRKYLRNAHAPEYAWARGLPEAATVEARAFADDGAALRACMPLIDLTVRNVQTVGPSFFDLPMLAGLRSLRFAASKVDTGIVAAIANSTHLSRLRVLDLAHCGLPASTLDTLAQSAVLRELRYVRLDGNAFDDPNPVRDEDEGGYRGDKPTRAAELLRQRHGDHAWFNGHAADYAPHAEAFD